MTTKILKEVLERAEKWPEEAQRELADIALAIDESLSGGLYYASDEELNGIDRGAKAAKEGRFASDADVRAVLRRHRPE